jgi:hypothetical protein
MLRARDTHTSDNPDMGDLAIYPHRMGNLVYRQLTHRGPPAKAQPDLDEPLVFEDPVRLSDRSLGVSELLGQIRLRWQSITGAEITACDPVAELVGDHHRRLHAGVLVRSAMTIARTGCARVGHIPRWICAGTQRHRRSAGGEQIRSACERAGLAKVLVTS